jgi:hypothetical protein
LQTKVQEERSNSRHNLSEWGKVKENGERDAIKGHTAKRAQRDVSS